MTLQSNLKYFISVFAVVFSVFSITGCSDDVTSIQQVEDTSELSSITSNAKAGNGADKAHEAATHTYEVTIENLTDGQPFSPGVLVTHTKQASVWEVGKSASDLIILIAEDGLAPGNLPEGVSPDDLVNDLSEEEGIFQVVKTGVPIDDNTPTILEGAPDPPSSRTFTIEAAANANRLSAAIMTICTNDGFTGLSGVKLPKGLKQTAVFNTEVYDAGSEPNTELYTDIVDPCQVIGPDTGPPAIPNGNDTPEGDIGLIHLHQGIQGIAVESGLDPTLHGWNGSAAKITVQRIE